MLLDVISRGLIEVEEEKTKKRYQRSAYLTEIEKKKIKQYRCYAMLFCTLLKIILPVHQTWNAENLRLAKLAYWKLLQNSEISKLAFKQLQKLFLET